MKEKGKNPFANLSQLLFASSAIGERLGADRILTSLAEGKIKHDQTVWEIANWMANEGSPAHLSKLLVLATETKSVSRQHAFLNALLTAKKLRKINPSGTERIAPFLQSENDTVFGVAAQLAGLWKVESSRPAMEKILNDESVPKARIKVALESLITLGGEKTSSYLNQLFGNPKTTYMRKAMVVTAQLKVQPILAARRAVKLLQGAPDGKDKFGIYSAFLGNQRATRALATEISQVNLSEPIALQGLQLAESSPTRPKELIAAIQKAGGLKPMKMSLTLSEMASMIERVGKRGDAARGKRFTAGRICSAWLAMRSEKSVGSSVPTWFPSERVLHDYLIESLLEPSKKIKEGYHTNLVTLKNGDARRGIVSESKTEL